MSLNRSGISKYKTKKNELKSIHNVLGILLNIILKIRKSRFYENFYSKYFRMLPVFDKLFGYFWGDNILYIFLKTENVVI